MKLPPLIGVFQAKFPGFGTYGDPNCCDLACHRPGGPCMSIRYQPLGLAGIDHDGNVWVLVTDYAHIEGEPRTNMERLRWVMFPAPVTMPDT